MYKSVDLLVYCFVGPSIGNAKKIKELNSSYKKKEKKISWEFDSFIFLALKGATRREEGRRDLNSAIASRYIYKGFL